jgi:hypothetical protein
LPHKRDEVTAWAEGDLLVTHGGRIAHGMIHPSTYGYFRKMEAYCGFWLHKPKVREDQPVCKTCQDEALLRAPRRTHDDVGQ